MTATATLHTTSEVAELLRTSQRQVTIWCANGSLRASKMGRQWLISPDDLAEFIDGNANRTRRTRRRRVA